MPDEAAAVDIAEFQSRGLGTDATVVDLATGTGRSAVAAAEHCRRVVAVDVSPAMLRLAQDRAAAAGCSNVEYDFRPDEADDVFDGWLARAVADPALGDTSEDFAEHIRSEHSTFRWLLEPMLHAAGFDNIDVDFRDRVYGAYTCVKR